MISIVLILFDTLFSCSISLLELYYIQKFFFVKLFSNLIPMLTLSLLFIIILSFKKLTLCHIIEIIYLTLGILFWVYKFLTTLYLVFSGRTLEFYSKEFKDNYYNFVVFVCETITLGLRLICCEFIRRMMGEIQKVNEYYLEKEQSDFIIKLGNKMTEGDLTIGGLDGNCSDVRIDDVY